MADEEDDEDDEGGNNYEIVASKPASAGDGSAEWEEQIWAEKCIN